MGFSPGTGTLSHPPLASFRVSVCARKMDWDLHFFPISFMCGGLYQKIKDYTFVGKMDDTFYQELGRFIQLYPDLKDAVEEGFKMKGKEEEQNVGTEKKAALLAQGYFTPNTVRKALQYYSIDYMLLGLEIPQWAEEILERDETYLLWKPWIYFHVWTICGTQEQASWFLVQALIFGAPTTFPEDNR